MSFNFIAPAGLRAGRPALVARAFAEDFTSDLNAQADWSGPVGVATITAVSEAMSCVFEATCAGTRVLVSVIATDAKGFDVGALDPRQEHSVTFAHDDTTMFDANDAYIPGPTARNKDTAYA